MISSVIFVVSVIVIYTVQYYLFKWIGLDSIEFFDFLVVCFLFVMFSDITDIKEKMGFNEKLDVEKKQ